MTAPLTEHQRTQIRAEFAQRRRRQLIATVPGIAAALAVGFAEEGTIARLLGVSPDVVVTGAVVVILGLVAFSLRNWRCPACDGYLGRSLNPRFCFKCGAELR